VNVEWSEYVAVGDATFAVPLAGHQVRMQHSVVRGSVRAVTHAAGRGIS
jgi:hypothetical protein